VKGEKMNAPLKITKGSDNIFRDLGFPEGEAQNLLLRTDLMIKIEKLVKKSGFTQSEAAEMLGVTQPRINDLLKGHIEKFSLDALVNMLSRAGMQVKMIVKKAA
jgi:predicted XRE-type DNA-binding protein